MPQLKIMAGRGRRSAQSRRYEQNRKIKKFVKELKPSLKTRLLELDSRSLEEVLGVANKQENKVESYQRENEAQKEGVPKPFQRQERKMKKLMKGQQSTVASSSEKLECIHCGKRHGGNACWRKEGRCLRCDSKDHRLKGCPNLKTKFIPRDVSSAVIKEQGLVKDDLDDVITGRVEELLVAEELWNDHKKPFFFPFSSAVICTNHSLEVDQRFGVFMGWQAGPKTPACSLSVNATVRDVAI
ncbi:hypothetical protein Taro_015120 [Colocasia esculenta]|uniref:Uncharacterized protein n=1 Tax=Colocasia esculenta TaxID=4460 RepID=A0A843UGP6_COLES|nr:hypothetical protein [Colocasia esculenta]